MWIRENFENYTKEEFKNLDDSKLLEAATFWMFGKITDWNQEIEIVSKFNEACKYVHSCSMVFNEIMNGGLNQLFFNPAVEHVEIAYKGFNQLGLTKLSDSLAKAVEIYNSNYEKLNEYEDGSIESFSKSYELKLFDNLDNAFSKEEEHFYKAITKYIKENIDCFGN